MTGRLNYQRNIARARREEKYKNEQHKGWVDRGPPQNFKKMASKSDTPVQKTINRMAQTVRNKKMKVTLADKA